MFQNDWDLSNVTLTIVAFDQGFSEKKKQTSSFITLQNVFRKYYLPQSFGVSIQL